MKKLILICVAIITIQGLYSQNFTPLFSGTIEYEKRINIVKQYSKYSKLSEDKIKRLPQYKASYFSLFFDSSKTLYQPNIQKKTNFNEWQFPAEDNIVFNDFNTSKTVTQKRLEDNFFLISDSIRQLNWHLVDETRSIAGYECRRANTMLWDSIFVVAFYSEDLPISGGPESFTGLPGMILGLVIPDEFISIYASSVTKDIQRELLKEPNKGTQTKENQLDKLIKPILSSYGKDSELYRIGMLL